MFVFKLKRKFTFEQIYMLLPLIIYIGNWVLDCLDREYWYKLPYLQDKSLSREQKITLKEKCANTMIAKQTLDTMGWEFDATKSREEQVKGL